MKVTSVSKLTWGHLAVGLSDGSTTIFGRGEPQPDVKVGDEYPPAVESPSALPSESDLDAVSVEQQAAADTEGQTVQASLDEQLAEQPASEPSPVEVVPDAVGTQASEAPAVEGKPFIVSAAGQDEAGIAPEPEDGPREEGQ